MIDFENPGVFLLLLLIPLVYILRSTKVFAHISIPMTLKDWDGSSFEWKQPSRRVSSIFVHAFVCAGYILLVLALANPVTRHQEKVYTSRGSEVFFVIDISPSMAARDIGGQTRLEASKNVIRTILQDNTGLSVGIVEMAKDADVLVPPTMDRKTFFEKLDSLVPGLLGDRTAIGTGLSAAILHLDYSKAPKKAIVLITDGENNAGAIHPNTAARLAKEKGISLYVLGVGTRGSVPLEYTDPYTGRVTSGFLPSDYDTTSLARIALEGNGIFYEIPTINLLTQVLKAISKNENVVQSYHVRDNNTSYAHQCLMFAALCAIIAWTIRRFMLQEVL